MIKGGKGVWGGIRGVRFGGVEKVDKMIPTEALDIRFFRYNKVILVKKFKD